MRIAVGGIHIECSTYNPVLTRSEDFTVLRGAELAAAGIEFETDEAYRQRYRAELVALNEHAPLYPDARLWQTAG